MVRTQAQQHLQRQLQQPNIVFYLLTASLIRRIRQLVLLLMLCICMLKFCNLIQATQQQQIISVWRPFFRANLVSQLILEFISTIWFKTDWWRLVEWWFYGLYIFPATQPSRLKNGREQSILNPKPLWPGLMLSSSITRRLTEGWCSFYTSSAVWHNTYESLRTPSRLTGPS